MKQLTQEIEINSLGEPVIAGTKVTVKRILEELAAGINPNTVIAKLQLPDDLVMDTAVEYAEKQPLGSAWHELLLQYRLLQMRKVRQILSQFKQHCQQKYGQRLVYVILFGSQARGDFRPSSDIDVLVVLEPPLNWNNDSQQVSDIVGDVSISTGELISCIFMESERFQHGREYLLAAVRQDGVLI